MFVFNGTIPLADQDDYPRVCWHNVASEGTVTGTNTVTGYPATNILNPSMSEYWEADIDGQGADLEFTFTSVTLDYVAIVMPKKLNVLLGENDNQLSVQYHNGSAWASFSTSIGTIRLVENIFVIHFAEVTTDQIRIRFNYPGHAATENLQVSSVFIGSILKLPRKIYTGYAPPSLNRKTKLISNVSESGRFLGRTIRNTSVSGSVSQEHLYPQDYRDDIEPFALHCRENPFFFAWRPATYREETQFCWLNGDVQVSNQLSNGMMQCSFDFQAFYND